MGKLIFSLLVPIALLCVGCANFLGHDSDAPEMLSFSINDCEGTIWGDQGVIVVPLDEDPGYDVTSLAADFSFKGKRVTVGGAAQIPGSSTQDYRDILTFTVESASGSRSYLVSVYLTGKTKLLFSEYFNYEEGGDETDDEKLGGFTEYSEEGDNFSWFWSDKGGQEEYVQMSGYNSSNGTYEISSDWLVTREALDLTGYSNISLYFEAAMNYSSATSGVRLKVSTDYGGAGNPGDYDWTDISDEADWTAGGSWTFVSSGAVDLSPYADKSVYIAFHYTSTGTSNCETWEIDDVEITGERDG